MSLQTAAYQAVQRDLTHHFNNKAKKATPFFPHLCTVVPSSSIDEKYGWLGNTPGMREWIGPRVFKQLRAADYTLANKHWESSLEVLKTDVRDDRTGKYRMQMAQLANEAMYHPDELLFEKVINLGESVACYDGQYFFDTDHVWGDSGTQSNDLEYACVDPTAPTTAELRAAVAQAVNAMLGFKNDQGKPFIRPRIGRMDDLMICQPVALREQMHKAFDQAVVVEGGAGVSNHFIERPEIVTINYMGAAFANGSDVKFDLYHTGGELKPYVFQAREPISSQWKGADDIEFKELKYMTEARYNIGHLWWPAAVRTTLTTA